MVEEAQRLTASDRRRLVAEIQKGLVSDLGFCGVERVSEEDESLAIDLVRSHEDKTYSLCDAMSFVVMARLGITDAIAFDRHFAEYGRFALL